jgi:hypothetical protein
MEHTFFFFGCVSSSSAGTVFLKDFFTALPLGFAGGAPAASSAFFFPSLQGFAGGASAASYAVFFPSPRFDKEGEAADACGAGAAFPAAAAAAATKAGAVAVSSWGGSASSADFFPAPLGFDNGEGAADA